MGDNDNMKFRIDCDPYNHIIKLLCNRWKPYIVRAIHIDNSTRFSRFTKQLPISERVLARNLKELDEDGIIDRTVFPNEIPVRVEYTLTEVGETLIPILDAMYKWGWEDMKRKGMEIDPLGEMWHDYRTRDEEKMRNIYKSNN